MLSYAAFITTGLVMQVAAHGIVNKVTVTGGKSYDGYVPYGSTANKVGWLTPGNKDWGFVPPTSYGSSEIICHKEASPATAAVEVAAGGELTLQWDQWAESHHGPVIDYLAPAGTDDISKIDKTQLKFVKIAEGGQTGGKTSNPPALLFASDDLRKANLNWKVKIPANVKAGIYVLRHELIALHAAEKLNEAQNYPQCITLKVTGSGDQAPSGGIPATSFYKATDPGINYNLYWDVKLPYQIPGPALWSGAGSSTTPATPSAAASPSSRPSASKPAASPVVKAVDKPAPQESSTPSGSSGAPSAGTEVEPSSQAPPPSSNCRKHRKGKDHRGDRDRRHHARDLAML